MEPVVRDLLLRHYDPVYTASMERNFKQYAQARQLSPNDHSAAAMAALAQSLYWARSENKKTGITKAGNVGFAIDFAIDSIAVRARF